MSQRNVPEGYFIGSDVEVLGEHKEKKLRQYSLFKEAEGDDYNFVGYVYQCVERWSHKHGRIRIAVFEAVRWRHRATNQVPYYYSTYSDTRKQAILDLIEDHKPMSGGN